MPVYEGADQGVIKAYASDDTPLLVMARSNPRRKLEKEFLKSKATVSLIKDAPIVKGRKILWRFVIGGKCIGVSGKNNSRDRLFSEM